MSDEPVVQTTAGEAAPPKAGGVKGFFASTLGKVVLIGGAVAVLLTIIAVVAVILLGGFLVSSVTEQPTQPPVTSTPPGSTSVTTPVAAVPVVDNSDVFTPRDPFQPVLIPRSAQVSAEEEGTDSDSDTLTLTEIIEEDGVRKAVLRLGSTTYTVAAGERLGTTPWQVLTVGTNSVTMLFGDSQVVLTVGQGIQTK